MRLHALVAHRPQRSYQQIELAALAHLWAAVERPEEAALALALGSKRAARGGQCANQWPNSSFDFLLVKLSNLRTKYRSATKRELTLTRTPSSRPGPSSHTSQAQSLSHTASSQKHARDTRALALALTKHKRTPARPAAPTSLTTPPIDQHTVSAAAQPLVGAAGHGVGFGGAQQSPTAAETSSRGDVTSLKSDRLLHTSAEDAERPIGRRWDARKGDLGATLIEHAEAPVVREAHARVCRRPLLEKETVAPRMPAVVGAAHGEHLPAVGGRVAKEDDAGSVGLGRLGGGGGAAPAARVGACGDGRARGDEGGALAALRLRLDQDFIVARTLPRLAVVIRCVDHLDTWGTKIRSVVARAASCGMVSHCGARRPVEGVVPRGVRRPVEGVVPRGVRRLVEGCGASWCAAASRGVWCLVVCGG